MRSADGEENDPKAEQGSIDQDGEPISDADFKPLQIWTKIARHPRRNYLLVLLFQVFVGMLFVVTPQVSTTSPTQGDTDEFLRFEYTVPVFIRKNFQQKRQDAVYAAMRDADASLSLPQVQLRQSVSGGFAATEENRLELELVYVPKAGDVFRRNSLAEIWELEKRIVSNPRYSEVCLRDWSAQEREVEHRQLIVFDDVARRAATQDTASLNAAPPPCAPPISLLWACNPRAGGRTSSCEEQVLAQEAWPPGVLHCDVNSTGYTERHGCTPEGMSLNHQLTRAGNLTVNSTYREFVVTQYARALLSNTSSSAKKASMKRFYESASENFGRLGSTVSGALRSRFRFALPLKGYANADDRRNEQLREIEEYLWKEFTSAGDSMFAGTGVTVEVTYTGFGQEDLYVKFQARRDLALLFASRIIDMAVIMFAMKDTLFAFAATFEMYAAVGVGYVLLFSFFNDIYFGLVSVTVIAMSFTTFRTVALSIGDAWCQSSAHQGAVSSSLMHRISYTWVRSSKSVALTSATLFACFTSMSLSELPVMTLVGRFGLLMMLIYAMSSLTSLHISLLASQAFFPGQMFWGDAVGVKFNETFHRIRLWLFPILTPAQLKKRRRRLAAARAAGAEDGDIHKMSEEDLDALEKEFADSAEEADKADEVEKGKGDEHDGWEDEVEEEEETSSLRILEEFFNQYFSAAVLQYRVAVLAVCILLVALHAFFATRVNWGNLKEERLTIDVPFRQIGIHKDEYFPLRTRIEEGFRVRFVSGLEPGDPIDRRGSRYNIREYVGSPRWLKEQTSSYVGGANGTRADAAGLDALWLHKYNWTTGSSSLGCLKRMCELAEKKSEERFTSGGNIYQTACWIRRFSQWTEETKGVSGKRSRVLADAYAMPFNIYAGLGWNDVERDKSLLYPMMFDWLRSQSPDDPAMTELDEWKKFIWSARVGWNEASSSDLTTVGWQPTTSGTSMPTRGMTGVPSPPPPPPFPPPINPANKTLFGSAIRLTFAELPIISGFDLQYKEGIELGRRWEEWHAEVLRATAECKSEEVKRVSGFQTASPPGWAHFNLQNTLVEEREILPVIIVLTMTLGTALVLWNWWMALMVVAMGALNQVLAYGFVGMVGWRMGMVESVTVLALPAVSIDFVAQIAQGYMDAAADVDTDQPIEDQQADRVVMALTYSGVTVVESLIAHMLSTAPMFLSKVEPTFRSNAIIYYISLASAFSSLFFFPVILSFVGPVGNFGSMTIFQTMPKKKQEFLEEERRLLRVRTGLNLKQRGVLAALFARLLGAGGGKRAKSIEPEK